MTTEADRLLMAKYIVDFEARRDTQGRLAVYALPYNDGGGSYEVAGINDRYHPKAAARLKAMIDRGDHAAAEGFAQRYLVAYTDVVLQWGVNSPAVEFFLRDCIFNRGPTGAAKILQIALVVGVDGQVGPKTKKALEEWVPVLLLLDRLRASRESYERDYVGYRANLWQGLVNRWDKTLAAAKTFPLRSLPVDLTPAKVPDKVPEAPSTIEWLKNAVSRWFSRPAATANVNLDNKPFIPTVFVPKSDRGYRDEDLRDPNFPPRPHFMPLVGTAARQRVFGAFQYRWAPVAGNPENIVITDGWADKNIVRVAIPQLARTKIAHPPSAMYFHRLAAEQLKGLFADWEAAGLLDLVLTYEGSFVPRFIRGSRSVLSNHAFGTAFDINYAWNALGATPAKAGTKGSVRELVPIAHRWGFYWGGHFTGRPDGMHFEVAKIL